MKFVDFFKLRNNSMQNDDYDSRFRSTTAKLDNSSDELYSSKYDISQYKKVANLLIIDVDSD